MEGPVEDPLAFLRGKAAAGLTLFCLLLGGLGWRLWQLQIHQGDYFFGQAQLLANRRISVPAPRGKIVDRNGLVLAQDLPSFVATLSYTTTPPSAAEITLLERILGLDAQAVDAAVAQLRQDLPYAPAVLKSGLSPAQYTAIVENASLLPGVSVVPEPVRTYPGIAGDSDPGTELAANIIGYVAAGDQPGDIKGVADVEQTFEHVKAASGTTAGLAGTDGEELIAVDKEYRPVHTYATIAPVPGDDVVLTLDAGLQAVAQHALDAQLVALRTQSFGTDGGPFPDAYAGSAIAIDVRTGEILALASEPTFDPNAFAKAALALPHSADETAFTARYQTWLNTPGNPFFDGAISGSAAPGSTFKPITAIAALQEGVITPETHIDCPTRIPVGNTFLNNWIPTWGGTLDLTEAIARSCDTYFYTVGARTGPQAISDLAAAFGLGQLTGQRALGAESAGTLSTPETVSPWTTALTMQTAIGQGRNAFTPLQMAVYVAALANGGRVLRPYLVSSIKSPDGKVLWSQQTEVRNQVPMSPSIVAAIHTAMTATTEWHDEWKADGVDAVFGTAYWPFYEFSQLTQQYLGRSIEVAGKTGTAETVPGVTPDGWFVSWAPADNPEIAIVVHTEHSGEGFVGGAPIAREMYDYYFGLDQKMWAAGAADQIIPPAIQMYFGQSVHYPDWWGAPPAPPAASSGAAAGGGGAVAPPVGGTAAGAG